MTAAHDIFWLAHYTQNTLAPLIAELKVIEPTIFHSIEVTFADSDSWNRKKNFIGVNVHWARDGMFLHETNKGTKAEIDQMAKRFRAKLDVLKAKAAVALLEPTFTF